MHFHIYFDQFQIKQINYSYIQKVTHIISKWFIKPIIYSIVKKFINFRSFVRTVSEKHDYLCCINVIYYYFIFSSIRKLKHTVNKFSILISIDKWPFKFWIDIFEFLWNVRINSVFIRQWIKWLIEYNWIEHMSIFIIIIIEIFFDFYRFIELLNVRLKKWQKIWINCSNFFNDWWKCFYCLWPPFNESVNKEWLKEKFKLVFFCGQFV